MTTKEVLREIITFQSAWEKADAKFREVLAFSCTPYPPELEKVSQEIATAIKEAKEAVVQELRIPALTAHNKVSDNLAVWKARTALVIESISGRCRLN